MLIEWNYGRIHPLLDWGGTVDVISLLKERNNRNIRVQEESDSGTCPLESVGILANFVRIVVKCDWAILIEVEAVKDCDLVQMVHLLIEGVWGAKVNKDFPTKLIVFNYLVKIIAWYWEESFLSHFCHFLGVGLGSFEQVLSIFYSVCKI